MLFSPYTTKKLVSQERRIEGTQDRPSKTAQMMLSHKMLSHKMLWRFADDQFAMASPTYYQSTAESSAQISSYSPVYGLIYLAFKSSPLRKPK